MICLIRCIYTIILLIISIYIDANLFGQSISSLGTGEIVELESVQSSVTGTLVVSSMERDSNSKTKVLIHRSTDNGFSWDFVDSIVPLMGGSEVPDPVITSDDSGNFYIANMRVNNGIPPSLTTVDIEVYKSSDDGQNWVLAGIPHLNNSIADYPQIIAKGDGELFLVYSYLTGFPLIDDAILTFKKSTDGGSTWTAGIEIDADSLRSIGADFSWFANDTLLISTGNRDSSLIHCYASSDLGDTWNEIQTFTIPNGETSHLAKPISNPLYSYYGVISHKPHSENTPIAYHSEINGISKSQIIDFGAYAQGYITDDGIIHLVYNKRENGVFTIRYLYSNDAGVTFSSPISIYTGTFVDSEFGEYQSLIYGNDGLFYLTFCDWSDNSAAKTLTFPPLITTSVKKASVNNLQVFPNPTSGVFRVKLPNHQQKVKIRIIDLKGNIVEESIVAQNDQTINFDISYLESGIYLVLLENDTKIMVEQIIKI